MSETPSPLGRYDETAADDALYEVRLLGLPVRVLSAARQHHDELMREFALLAMASEDGSGGGRTLPARLVELIQVLGVRYGRMTDRPDAAVDAAIDRGEDTIDVTYQVPGHVVAAADHLEALMAEADEFCRQEEMLTLQRTDLQVRFAQWYLSEFRRQLAGEPPRPWEGPLDPA